MNRNREGGKNTLAPNLIVYAMLIKTHRIACEVFCQDMVHCIFLGRTPNLDPRQFPVELPGYETCWEAETASDCLHRLQILPKQLRVSTAIEMLTLWPNTKVPLFEASGFGMFVLANGSMTHTARIMCLKLI